MRLTEITAVLLVCAAALSPSALPPEPLASPTTVLVVRHADRDGQNDALTSAGEARAKELVHVAGKAGVSAIYCTKTARSRKTAEPLATASKLTPVELDPKDVDGLAKKIRADQQGKTVLVVAHSNTVPLILAALGGPKLSDIDETDFDDLFVLTIGSGSPAAVGLVSLQYGAATP